MALSMTLKLVHSTFSTTQYLSYAHAVTHAVARMLVTSILEEYVLKGSN